MAENANYDLLVNAIMVTVDAVIDQHRRVVQPFGTAETEYCYCDSDMYMDGAAYRAHLSTEIRNALKENK